MNRHDRWLCATESKDNESDHVMLEDAAHALDPEGEHWERSHGLRDRIDARFRAVMVEDRSRGLETAVALSLTPIGS